MRRFAACGSVDGLCFQVGHVLSVLMMEIGIDAGR